MAGRKIKNPDITKEMFLEELERQKGSCYAAYNKLGLAYSRYYQWRKEDQEFDNACKEMQKSMVEYAEQRMYDLIKEGNTQMLKFFLSARGDYSEKKQLEIKSDNVVDINKTLEEIKEELS